jgi:hypothetical protein
MDSDFLEHSQHEITLEWLVENLRLGHLFLADGSRKVGLEYEPT